MKKLILALTLLASMSSFADCEYQGEVVKSGESILSVAPNLDFKSLSKNTNIKDVFCFGDSFKALVYKPTYMAIEMNINKTGCFYNGVKQGVGSRLAGFTCADNGKWED